jgi:hypothetical protein
MHTTVLMGVASFFIHIVTAILDIMEFVLYSRSLIAFVELEYFAWKMPQAHQRSPESQYLLHRTKPVFSGKVRGGND